MAMFRFFSFFFVFLLLFISCSGKKKDHPATLSPEGVDLKGHIVGTVFPRTTISVLIGGEFSYDIKTDQNGFFNLKIPDKYCQTKKSDLIIVFKDKKRKKFLQKRFKRPLDCSQVLNLGELDLLPLGRMSIKVSINNRFSDRPSHAEAIVVGWKDDIRMDADGSITLDLPVGRWDISVVSDGYDPVLLKNVEIKLPEISLESIVLPTSSKMSGVPTINNNIGYYVGFNVMIGVLNANNVVAYSVVPESDLSFQSEWFSVDTIEKYSLTSLISDENRLLFYFSDKDGNISEPVPATSHYLEKSFFQDMFSYSDVTNPIIYFDGFLEKDFGSTIEIYSDDKCSNKIHEQVVGKSKEVVDALYYTENEENILTYLKLTNKNNSFCFNDSILDYYLNLDKFFVWPFHDDETVDANNFRPQWTGRADDKNFFYSLKLCKNFLCNDSCYNEVSNIKLGALLNITHPKKGENYVCIRANSKNKKESYEWVSSTGRIFIKNYPKISPDDITLLNDAAYIPQWDSKYSYYDDGNLFTYNLWISEKRDCVTNKKSLIKNAVSGSSVLSLPDDKFYYVCLERVYLDTKKFHSLTVSEGQISFRNTMPQIEENNPNLPNPWPYKRPILSGPNYKVSWTNAKVDDLFYYQVSACEDKLCTLNCLSQKKFFADNKSSKLENSNFETVLSGLLPGHSYYMCVETFNSKNESYGTSHSSSFVYINIPMYLEKGMGSVGDDLSLLIPSSRKNMSFWKGGDGGLFIFAGSKDASSGEEVFFNDLWKFSQGDWHFIKGSKEINSKGVYGNYQLASKDNMPSARRGGSVFTDLLGNTWLFGGFGYDSNGKLGYLNDLWKFDGEMWTWMGGRNVVTNDLSLYDIPEGRERAFSWVDDKGVAWLFGGQVGSDLFVNDLWKFENGVFERVIGNNNDLRPYARAGGVVQKGKDGLIYLFGGEGVSPTGQNGFFSDLWSFDGTQWKNLFHDEALNRMGHYMVANKIGGYPGARKNAFSWVDRLGRFWIMGGFGIGEDGNEGYLNDFWYFENGNWTWVTGSSFINMPMALGEKGPLNQLTILGGRMAGASWVDSDAGHVWLFGGFGFGSQKKHGDKIFGPLNDLWKIIIP